MPGSTLSILRLTLVDGVGPILGRRLLAAFGSPERVFECAPADLERIEGIGPVRARRIHASILASADALDRELALIETSRARVIALGDAAYPPLLAEAPDAPLVLYARGAPPCPEGSFPVAIVGSRHCTAYGVEQAERFSATLAQQGLVVVSGGARGVDSAAHRAALRVGGTTIVVMGCGLGHCYPPENASLFDDIASRGGTILSELPIDTGPSPDNFPARNRVIAAMSLGVLVIEAPRGSGALITARVAIDDYNREVLAVPGRVDSPASQGSNDLIKSGEAAMATAPSDVIDALESAARHHHAGTHGPRFAPAGAIEPRGDGAAAPRFGQADRPPPTPARRTTAPTIASPSAAAITESQRTLVAALAEPASIDDLCRRTGLEAATILSDAAILEVRGMITRVGSRYHARKS